MKNNSAKSRFWLYLIPLYILIAIPLIKWTIKLSSSDIKLSEDDLKAFSTDKKLKIDDFKLYEPSLDDVSYAVRYKNIEEDSKNSKTIKIKNDEDLSKYTTKKNNNTKEQNPISVKSDEKEIPQTKDIKAKEMSAIGYKKGFLTDVTGKLLNNPKALKSLFNNEYVVNGFLSRDIVKRNLNDPNALKSYLTNTNAISNFINNPIVKQVLNNPTLLNTIAQTKLVQDIMASPAVSTILSDPDTRNEILTKNPQIGELISNPNISQAISQNPNASRFLIGQ